MYNFYDVLKTLQMDMGMNVLKIMAMNVSAANATQAVMENEDMSSWQMLANYRDQWMKRGGSKEKMSGSKEKNKASKEKNSDSKSKNSKNKSKNKMSKSKAKSGESKDMSMEYGMMDDMRWFFMHFVPRRRLVYGDYGGLCG